MKSLRFDVSALSELVILLILVIGIILLLAIVGGGIILTLGIFFGGRLGLGFGLTILGGLVLLVSFAPFARAFAKAGLYLGGGLLVLGVIFMALGALGH